MKRTKMIRVLLDMVEHLDADENNPRNNYDEAVIQALHGEIESLRTEAAKNNQSILDAAETANNHESLRDAVADGYVFAIRQNSGGTEVVVDHTDDFECHRIFWDNSAGVALWFAIEFIADEMAAQKCQSLRNAVAAGHSLFATRGAVWQ